MLQKKLSSGVRLTVERLVEQLMKDEVIFEVQDQKGQEEQELYAFPRLLQLIK